jgi:uncharacterized membrane protein
MHIALWLHLLGTVVWVGGMFFAHVVLRPAVQTLAPPERLGLMAAILGTFFRWVGAAVALILVSGFFLVHGMGGFRPVGAYVHAMTVLGLAMAGVYGYVVAGPWPRLRAAVADQRWPDAAATLGTIRRLVATNLVLGLATITVAVLGQTV